MQHFNSVKLSVFTHGVKLSAVSNCPFLPMVSNCPRCQIVHGVKLSGVKLSYNHCNALLHTIFVFSAYASILAGKKNGKE